MTGKLSETCIGCPAYITSTKYANIDFCKYSVGSVPRINCELGGILKHEKALEAENQSLRKTLDDGTTLLVAQNNEMNDLQSRLSGAEKNYNWRLEKCFGFRDATDINCESCPPILLEYCIIVTKKALK